jgi:hypothetical protein
MGYGEGAIARIFKNMQGGTAKVYIRRNFDFVRKKVPMTLVMDIDDGFVAYINDKEVARNNYTTGDTAATSHESGSFERFPLDANALFRSILKGRTNHVLAIEGYNVSIDSSDFVITPELRHE